MVVGDLHHAMVPILHSGESAARSKGGFVSGSPGNWESQWFDGEFKQLTGDAYERSDDSLDAPMAAAFQNWLEEINERDIETSTAYDVVGGRFSRGGFERFFDKEPYHTDDMNMGWRVTMKKNGFTLRT